jgi:3-hydroxyacyl-CoA dehydrogenase
MQDIETMAVLGAGDTGSVVARAAALAGLHVRLYDPSPDALRRAIEHIRHGVQGAIARGRLSARDRQDILDGVLATTDLVEAVTDADLVIDAGPDLLDVKRELFAKLGRSCRANAILATTTTAFHLDAIALGVPQPGRVVGLRFAEPIEDANRVEVVVAAETSGETVERTCAFAARIGMATAVARESLRE